MADGNAGTKKLQRNQRRAIKRGQIALVETEGEVRDCLDGKLRLLHAFYGEIALSGVADQSQIDVVRAAIEAEETARKAYRDAANNTHDAFKAVVLEMGGNLRTREQLEDYLDEDFSDDDAVQARGGGSDTQNN